MILALKENPIVLAVCHKLGLPTSTYYRWLNDDPRFAKEARRAIAKGRVSVNDVAEAHVIKGVKKGDKAYVMWWLKIFHKDYRQSEKLTVLTRKSVSQSVSSPEIRLSPQSEALLTKAMQRTAHQFFRERQLIRKLGEKGVPDEEIEKLLQQADVKHGK